MRRGCMPVLRMFGWYLPTAPGARTRNVSGAGPAGAARNAERATSEAVREGLHGWVPSTLCDRPKIA